MRREKGAPLHLAVRGAGVVCAGAHEGVGLHPWSGRSVSRPSVSVRPTASLAHTFGRLTCLALPSRAPAPCLSERESPPTSLSKLTTCDVNPQRSTTFCHDPVLTPVQLQLANQREEAYRRREFTVDMGSLEAERDQIASYQQARQASMSPNHMLSRIIPRAVMLLPSFTMYCHGAVLSAVSHLRSPIAHIDRCSRRSRKWREFPHLPTSLRSSRLRCALLDPASGSRANPPHDTASRSDPAALCESCFCALTQRVLHLILQCFAPDSGTRFSQIVPLILPCACPSFSLV